MKVVIRNESGQYLAGGRGRVFFVDRKERAYVYDYEKDMVEEQLSVVRERFACEWSWEELGDCAGLTGLPVTPYRGRGS